MDMSQACFQRQCTWTLSVLYDKGGCFKIFPEVWSLQMLRRRCPSSKNIRSLVFSLKQWSLASQPPWLYLHQRPLLKIEIIMFTSPVTRTNVNVTAVCRHVCWQKKMFLACGLQMWLENLKFKLQSVNINILKGVFVTRIHFHLWNCPLYVKDHTCADLTQVIHQPHLKMFLKPVWGSSLLNISLN